MNTLNSLVAQHPFVGRMQAGHVEVLAGCAQEKQFHAGQVIFREGEPANQFYLVREGKVLLESHRPNRGDAPIHTIGAGDVLGWSWLFPPFVWHFQARALEATTVLAFDGGHLLVACERNHDFGYELMKRMAQVVIQRMQASRQRLLKGGNVAQPAGTKAKSA